MHPLGGLFDHWHQDMGVLVRLLVAAVLSGALGWERQSEGKSAGMRTHMLVGIGSAFFMCIVGMIVETFPHEPNVVRFDPVRILQAVVAGVSFLGAGTIFVDKSRHHVRGLTTAASIWTTTAVGLATGLGRYLVATLATILVLLVLGVVEWIEPPKPSEDADVAEAEEKKEQDRKLPNPGAM
jgi:putative Mg2+ transporter-C (MgtC) family protein